MGQMIPDGSVATNKFHIAELALAGVGEYTYPLLRWTPFLRSLLFTFVMTAIFLFEMRNSDWLESGIQQYAKYFVPIFLTNAISDYLSLFIVRPWLVRCGTKPIFALLSGTILAGIVVFLGLVIRTGISMYLFAITDIRQIPNWEERSGVTREEIESLDREIGSGGHQAALEVIYFFGLLIFSSIAALPATAVFIWLPLFGLGILVARLLTPMTWVVTKAQWALNEGNEHPLKAVGCVAAVAVFGFAVVWQSIFKV